MTIQTTDSNKKSVVSNKKIPVNIHQTHDSYLSLIPTDKYSTNM